MARVKCPQCEFVNADGQAVCARCNTPLPQIRIDPIPPRPKPPGPPQGGDPFSFRPGQIVAGRYTVEGLIGRGGMGCIYRVHDNVLKEDVALKTLLPQFVREKTVVGRFFNEARIARSLSHPNIVRVHDIGMTGNIIYISMELVNGKSLRNLLDDLAPGQRLPVRDALRIVDELCAALEYAHRHTVHRDIKPENVMVAADGTVKLMDFGISKLMSTRGLTATSMVMGTPFYMSPEQLRNSAGVDARADIYSVGVVLYEVLTGNVPTGIPKPASQLTREVPPALDPIVAKCVEPEPNRRFQSATELRAVLKPILEIATTGATRAWRPKSDTRARRMPALPLRKLAGIALIVLILALTAAGMYKMGSSVPAAQALPAIRQAPGPSHPVEDLAAQFKRIETLVTQARLRVPPETERVEAMTTVLAEADRRWELAKNAAARNDPEALVVARQGLECYLALKMWPPKMTFVPPGEVLLRDESTSGSVSLDGFFIDVCEVTNEEYLAFCTGAGWRQSPYDLAAAPPNQPVLNVTFYDALAYAAWAKKALPTEPQWARAAYGDRTLSDRYPWGPEWTPGSANMGGSRDGTVSAAIVGVFRDDRTWCGCLDMAGNVSEWTRSAFKPFPYDRDDGREDLDSLDFGALIVVRGSNYKDLTKAPLSARFASPFEAASDTLGFRCVLEIPSSLTNLDTVENAPASPTP